ncbi:alpha/beta fold hydrolase [Idiomarina seosinensis]|uniref:alpha/beta fold hydrolase n=1 Tax=Idiomarina seosinensis TaxID=281739 RepID=UPI00384CEFC8
MAEPLVLEHQTLGQSERPAVILIHGLFGDKDNLKSLARDLQEDFYCVMPDARNHGDSPHSEQMNYDLMAKDIIATCDHLGLKEFHLVGHSMGGKIAMQTAMDFSDRVLSAVFADIAPVAYDKSHDSILSALCNIDLSRINSRKEADEALQATIETAGIRQFLLKNLRKEDDGYEWRLNLKGLQDNYSALASAVSEGHYSGPVLFIKGGDSDYLQECHREAIKQRFNDVDVKIIENTGHWLHAEKPRVFNRLVSQFLNG